MAARIAALRDAKGWTQQQLGAELGVDKTAVSHWENGQRPEIASLPALAKVLNTTVPLLVAGEDWPAVNALLSIQAA